MQKQATSYQDLPHLGVGIGLRKSIWKETLEANDIINWVEFTPENYMVRRETSCSILDEAAYRYPLVAHGVSLSLGSTDPWNEKYLANLESLFNDYKPKWFSDHLCFSSVDGIYFNDLIPLPFTQEAMNHVVDRICFLQDRFTIPFIFENPSYYLDYAEDTYTEAEFISQILIKSGCGFLLDVNNVYVNCKNREGDPYVFLQNIPLDHVVQIHIAGHHIYPESIIDTHGSAVCHEVWELLQWVLQRCTPQGVMLERDLYIPPFAELRPEVEMIHKIWSDCKTTRPSLIIGSNA